MRTSRLLLPACLFLALLAGCGGQQPVLEIDPPIHDFGRVRFGEMRVTQFQIRNTSKQDVELVLKPNCGCFKVLDGGRRSLEPGQSGIFRIRFDAGPPLGPEVLKGKRLEIFTDHPDGNATIKLEGEIYQLAVLQPHITRVGRMTGDASTFEARQIKLRSIEKDAQIEIQQVAVTPPDVFSVSPEPVEGGFDLMLRQKDGIKRARSELNVVLDMRVRVASSDGTSEITSLRATVTGYWDADTTK